MMTNCLFGQTNPSRTQMANFLRKNRHTKRCCRPSCIKHKTNSDNWLQKKAFLSVHRLLVKKKKEKEKKRKKHSAACFEKHQRIVTVSLAHVAHEGIARLLELTGNAIILGTVSRACVGAGVGTVQMLTLKYKFVFPGCA